MRTSTKFLTAVASLATLLVWAGSGIQSVSARQAAPRADGEQTLALIDALDRRVQERFRELGTRFGLSRIVRADQGPHRLDAATISERNVVQELERAKLRVVLYVAGRGILRSDDSQPPAGTRRPPMQGPVLVTPAATQDTRGTLAGRDLWDEGREALLAFTEVDESRFSKAGWKFVVRPVRASDSVCLSCHREESAKTAPWKPGVTNALRVGDPLAAVLYAYQPLR